VEHIPVWLKLESLATDVHFMDARGGSTPSKSYDYFVKSTEHRPVHPPPQASGPKSRVGLVHIAVAVPLLCALVFGVNALRGPAPGSRDDLAGHLDGLEPSSMQQTREIYNSEEECPTSPTLCPSLVRWYSISGPVGEAREAAIARLEERGLEFESNDVEPNLIVARERHYIYFLVFHEPPLDGPLDRVLPPSVEADWSITRGGPYSTSPEP
jgi:hypothetical protein